MVGGGWGGVRVKRRKKRRKSVIGWVGIDGECEGRGGGKMKVSRCIKCELRGGLYYT